MLIIGFSPVQRPGEVTGVAPCRSRALGGDTAESKLLHTHAQSFHILLTTTWLGGSICGLHWLLRGGSCWRWLQLEGFLLSPCLLFLLFLLAIITELFYPLGFFGSLLLCLLKVKGSGSLLSTQTAELGLLRPSGAGNGTRSCRRRSQP